jgi:tripartite-type tricarboxylate transporter receptor subunit TctC
MSMIGRVAVLIAVLFAAEAAHAQTAYPNKPVRVIVPFAPGGATDVVARLMAQHLTSSLGQQFYIENHGGAGGNIGMGLAASAPADGYTVLIISNSFIFNTHLFNKIPYNPKDFAPVTAVATAPYLLTVTPNVPAQDLKEFIALVKANPGKFSYASSGRGTPGHLGGELFRLPLGLDIVHVPFNGGGPAIQATVAGHVQVSFNALPTGAPHVKAGKLRALAVTADKRHPAFPDVPTMAEGGVAGAEIAIVIGVLVRAGTPQPIVDTLHREIAKVTAAPEMSERLTFLGLDRVANSPAEFGGWIKAELPRWGKVIADAKIEKTN